MKASIQSLFIFFIFLLFSFPMYAQDKPTVLKNRNTHYLKDSTGLKKILPKKDSTDKKEISPGNPSQTASYLEVNLEYESNDVNNGRKDSSVIPLLTPKISYIFKSGFEIDLSIGYNVSEPSPQVNQYTLDGSYTFNAGNYSGTVTLSAFLYNKQSGSTTAEQKGSLEFDNSYNFGFIEPSLDLTWTVGTTPSDFQVSFAIQHEYDIGNLGITPTATMNVATQNSYNSYYKNRRFSIPREGQPNLPVNVSLSGTVLNAGKFQILDYELSAPVYYTQGKWTFNFIPTFAMPVNPADIQLMTKIDEQTYYRTYKEALPNTFYYQIGITYDF